MSAPRLLTVGHGTLAAEELLDLLGGAGVELLVDVRSFPGSRRHPHFGREAMETWVPAAGIEYRWERSLGGRRRPAPESRHPALRNEAFRAYADHMETDGFRAGLAGVLDLAVSRKTAVMCSESVWWRCHRRLLADAVVLTTDVVVEHLFHDGRLTTHAPTPEGRVDGDTVVYDLNVAAPLLPPRE